MDPNSGRSVVFPPSAGNRVKPGLREVRERSTNFLTAVQVSSLCEEFLPQDIFEQRVA